MNFQNKLAAQVIENRLNRKRSMDIILIPWLLLLETAHTRTHALESINTHGRLLKMKKKSQVVYCLFFC